MTFGNSHRSTLPSVMKFDTIYWSLQSILAMFSWSNWFLSIFINFELIFVDFYQFWSILDNFCQFWSILDNFSRFLTIFKCQIIVESKAKICKLWWKLDENCSKLIFDNFCQFWLDKNWPKSILDDFRLIFVNFHQFLSIFSNFRQFFNCQDWLQRPISAYCLSYMHRILDWIGSKSWSKEG